MRIPRHRHATRFLRRALFRFGSLVGPGAPFARRFFGAVGAVGAVGVVCSMQALTACVDFASVFDPGPTRVRIAEAGQPAFALVYVAEALGAFEREGLEIEWVEHSLGRHALEAVSLGKADVATVFSTPFVSRVRAGEGLVALAGLHRGSGHSAFVVPADAGREPRALEGRRVGLVGGTNGIHFLDTFSRSEAFRVKPVPVAFPSFEALRAALVERRVDGGAFTGTQVDLAVEALGRAGREAEVFTEPAYLESSMIVARRSFATERRPDVEKLLRALLHAQTFSRAQPDEALRMVQDRFPSEDPRHVASSLARLRARLNLDHVLLFDLEREWARLDAQALEQRAGGAGAAGVGGTNVPSDVAKRIRDSLLDAPLAAVSPLSVTLP